MNALPKIVRITLIHGVALMLAGLLFGAAVGAAPYPRLALGAHIQLTTNGVMFIVAGLLLAYLGANLRGISRLVLVAAPWGAWAMALSEAANAWWGASKTLPLAAAQAGATGGAPWQENLVLVAHIIGALAVLAYWFVIFAALLRTKVSEPDA